MHIGFHVGRITKLARPTFNIYHKALTVSIYALLVFLSKVELSVDG